MEDITKELNSDTEYLRAMKKSGHHKGDCDNILMHLSNIEDLVNKLFIAGVVRSAYLVQNRETLVNHGLFDSEGKAKNYIKGSIRQFAIQKVEIS